MKKGFTLVEMIAVILILALISITTLPSLLNQVSNKRKEVSETSKKIIYDAVDQYLSSKTITYSKSPESIGNTYCIDLNEVVNAGKLTSPVKDLETDNEIALNTVIKAYLNVYSDYEFCIVGYEENDVCNKNCTNE